MEARIIKRNGEKVFVDSTGKKWSLKAINELLMSLRKKKEIEETLDYYSM